MPIASIDDATALDFVAFWRGAFAAAAADPAVPADQRHGVGRTPGATASSDIDIPCGRQPRLGPASSHDAIAAPAPA